MVIIQVTKPDAFLLIPGKCFGGSVDVGVVRKRAMRPVRGMILLERLSDIGTLFGFEFFGAGECSTTKIS